MDRESRGLNALLVIIAVAGAGLWIGLVRWARGPAPQADMGAGFDLKQVAEPEPEPPTAPVALPPPPSSLMAPERLSPAPAAAPAAPAQTAAAPAAPAAEPEPKDDAQRLNRSVHEGFSQIAAIAKQHTAQSPSLQRWAQQWKASPDLRSLSERYKRDGDVVAFMRGLAAAPSFPQLLREHATDPAILGLATDMLTRAPAVIGQGLQFAMNDPALKTFTERSLQDAALPAELAQAAMAAAPAPASR